MTYPALIGAVLINGDADSAELEGIELVTTSTHRALGAMVVGGTVALELGDMRVGTKILIEGTDLVTTETQTLVLNMEIVFEGLDLVTHGVAVARMTINQVGVVALELGDMALQNGTDVEIGIAGIDLARASFHSIQTGPILPGNAILQPLSARPLELGDMALALGPVTLTAGGAVALEMGGMSTRVGLLVAGATALEMGDLQPVRLTIFGGGAIAMELGSISTAVEMTFEGIDLVRHGAPGINVAGLTLTAGGAIAMELGDLGMPTYGLRVRQHFALDLGSISVDRGNAC